MIIRTLSIAAAAFLTTVSVFLLSVVFVFLRFWVNRHGRHLFGRLNVAAASAGSPSRSGPGDDAADASNGA